MSDEEQNILREEEGIVIPEKRAPYIEIYGNKAEYEELLTVRNTLKRDISDLQSAIEEAGEDHPGLHAMKRANKMQKKFLGVVQEIIGEMNRLMEEEGLK